MKDFATKFTTYIRVVLYLVLVHILSDRWHQKKYIYLLYIIKMNVRCLLGVNSETTEPKKTKLAQYVCINPT